MTLRKWAAMYVWGIAFDSFYDFSIGIWNCYDSVVFVFLHFSFFRMTIQKSVILFFIGIELK
jgi:hypothetical protein